MTSVLMTMLNVESVTDLLTEFTVGEETYPTIFSTKQLTETQAGYKDLLQIYRVTLIGAGDYRPVSWTVNCRSNDEYKAETIAYAVYDAVNREFHGADGKDYFFVCTIQPSIREDENYWNVPVEIQIKHNE